MELHADYVTGHKDGWSPGSPLAGIALLYDRPGSLSTLIGRNLRDWARGVMLEPKEAALNCPTRLLSKGKPSPQMLGYLLALGSAAAIAATFIVRKSVSTEVNPATFSVWWYGLAGLYAWAFVLVRGETHLARGIRAGWKSVAGLALFNAAH